MLNLILKLAIEPFGVVFNIVSAILFSIPFSIQHFAFSIAKDHR